MRDPGVTGYRWSPIDGAEGTEEGAAASSGERALDS